MRRCLPDVPSMPHVREEYSNGDVYDGEVRLVPNDVTRRLTKHGWGSYIFAVGSRYDGEWEDGNMHGWGVFVESSTGDRYEGYWHSGKRSFGVYAYGNGDIYQGCFCNDSKQGRGIAWEGRQMFEVVYDNDKLIFKTPFDTTPRLSAMRHQGCLAVDVAPKRAAGSARPRAPRAVRSQQGRDDCPLPAEVVLLGSARTRLPSSRTVTAEEYHAALRVVRGDAAAKRISTLPEPSNATMPKTSHRSRSAPDGVARHRE